MTVVVCVNVGAEDVENAIDVVNIPLVVDDIEPEG